MKNDLETNEKYKSKYMEDEKELDKLKQQIKNYTSELLKKMQKNDDEKSFLTDNEDEEKKNKLRNIFVPQSPADLESLRIKYPKYSRQISPYVSPKKVKSPSERFKQRWSYINQETDDNNNFHRIITNDSDDNHFTYSNDEDLSLNSPNLTPIKKNNRDSYNNTNTNVNSIRPNDQSNSFSNGSPNIRFNKQYQQTSKPQKQQNYSSSESSLKVIQTEKFKIQNQKTESRESNQPNDSSSRIRDLRKAFEADFPPSSSEINHEFTNNAGNSQNTFGQLLIIEEEEEVNDEIVNSSNFNEEEEKTEFNSSNQQKNKNNELNLNNSNEEENENEYIDGEEEKEDDQNQYIEEEEEEEDIQIENLIVSKSEKTSQKENKDFKFKNEEEDNEIKSKTETLNPNFDIQMEEESNNEFGIDFNDEDDDGFENQINNQNEEETKNEFKIGLNESDEEEEIQVENSIKTEIKNNINNEEKENNFDIDFNESDEEEENQTENHQKTKIQYQQNLINKEEEENNLKINLNESNENQAQSVKYSFQSEDESKSGFMIDLNETEEEEEEEDILIENQLKILNNNESQNETKITGNKVQGNEANDNPIFKIDINIDDIDPTSNDQDENKQKRVESPDRKTKENLSFTTPKCPKGADSFLESSGLNSDLDNNNK